TCNNLQEFVRRSLVFLLANSKRAASGPSGRNLPQNSRQTSENDVEGKSAGRYNLPAFPGRSWNTTVIAAARRTASILTTRPCPRQPGAANEHGGSAMACQVFQWLLIAVEPTAMEHALIGIGCLLTYDAVSRWRKKRRAALIVQADFLSRENTG